MILVLRSVTNDAICAATQTPLFPLLLRHLEPFPLPQPPDSLAVHHVPFVTQQRPDPSIPEPRTRPNQLMHPTNDQRLVVPSLDRVPLRRSRLPDHPTRRPLRGLELILQLFDGFASTCRAYQFPPATSFSMALARACSATSFFSRAFSCSSSLSRLASLPFMPPY